MPDARENQARVALEGFIERHKESVFFSRQLEVQNEDEWYHWITNRALRELVGRGLLRTEVRELQTGGSIHLMWHKRITGTTDVMLRGSYSWYKNTRIRI